MKDVWERCGSFYIYFLIICSCFIEIFCFLFIFLFSLLFFRWYFRAKCWARYFVCSILSIFCCFLIHLLKKFLITLRYTVGLKYSIDFCEMKKKLKRFQRKISSTPCKFVYFSNWSVFPERCFHKYNKGKTNNRVERIFVLLGITIKKNKLWILRRASS
jgi:hypothetical protein